MEGGWGRLGWSACSVQGSPLGGWSVLRLHGQCGQEDPGKGEGEVE